MDKYKLKTNLIGKCTGKYMKLENGIPSEATQTQKGKHHIVYLICGN